MKSEGTRSELLELLLEAISREVQVSVQYMLQHGVGAGHEAAGHGAAQPDRVSKFVASHSQMWLPGVTLKKIAVTEMQHAEAIVERLVRLGERPPEGIVSPGLGETTRDMLGRDVKAEEEAIELYTRIIDVARQQGDSETGALFTRILSDERQHLSTFTKVLNAG